MGSFNDYDSMSRGAEGVVLDDQQEAGGVVWGLSNTEGNPPATGATRAPIQVATRGPRKASGERGDSKQTRSLDVDLESFKKLNANAAAFSPVQVCLIPPHEFYSKR